MKLKDFKFSEENVKVGLVRSEKIWQKIDFALKYLVKYLPVNKLKKDNSFNFNKLKFDEGKNYDWYFLNKKDLTILVRQYRNHFTFFVDNKTAHYFSHLSVFTINDNSDKMDGDTSDSFCDDRFQSITKYLPELVKIIENDNVHSIWNDYSFKVPKYTDVKIVMTNRENVDSLDLLLFACDELFSMYLSTYAENEVLEQIKKYKVGDKFGSSYVITKVKTEFPKEYSDPYYHDVGLEIINNNFPGSKPKWADVYSLAMYHYDELDYENIQIKKRVMKFIYNNHNNIVEELTKGKQEPFAYITIVSDYIRMAHKLYNTNLNIKTFGSCIDEEFKNFIDMSYRVYTN